MTRGLAPRSPPASNAGKPTSATGSLACRPAASSARTPTRPRSPPRRWPAFKVASYSPRCAATPTSSGSPSTQPARTSASPPPDFNASTERGMKMAVKFGLLALLEAKPDKGADLAAFLVAGRELALQEEGTVTWYAFKINETTYGIFDTFETVQARQAHIDGEIPKALDAVGADLLATDPDIRPIDILAVK